MCHSAGKPLCQQCVTTFSFALDLAVRSRHLVTDYVCFSRLDVLTMKKIKYVSVGTFTILFLMQL